MEVKTDEKEKLTERKLTTRENWLQGKIDWKEKLTEKKNWQRGKLTKMNLQGQNQRIT